MGKCLVRHLTPNGIELRDGGKITTVAVEPIEKKPLYHFFPSSKVLSVGGYGCSMTCDYCQNWKVSQKDRSADAKNLSPSELVKIALGKGCEGICMTYNEPTVYIEYLRELSRETQNANMYFAIKTNAFVNSTPWQEICSLVDAMNIDYKGTDYDYYRISSLTPEHRRCIMDNIVYALTLSGFINKKLHVEISIPVYESSRVKETMHSIREMISAYAPSTPVHLLKVFPANRIEHSRSTKNRLLFRSRKYMLEQIKYVYISNLFNNAAILTRNTICSYCGKIIVERKGFKVTTDWCGCAATAADFVKWGEG